MKKRILSGIRSSGSLHLGNYLGAVKGMLELQNDPQYETLYMVADLHSLTTPYDKSILTSATRNVIKDYLAAGLDPDKSVLFVQSQVAEHAELAYYLSTVMTVAKMQHLPTYKEKVKQFPENVTIALLDYPVLMAADILVYKAGLVPVGIDQEPHLEVAREIARRMNTDYEMDFPEPQRFATSGEYVGSLTGEGKMSKSVEGSYVALTDSLDVIRKKIYSVPTATTSGGEMPLGVKTLFSFLRLFVPNDVASYEKEFNAGTLQYQKLKDYLAEIIYAELLPIQEKHRELTDENVNKVIVEGAEKARVIAKQTVKEVKEKMGLLI